MILHLTGPIYGTSGECHEQAWVVDGRITYRDPGGDSQQISGWVVPGLVDVHCHIGLDAHGAVAADVAGQQAITDRDSGVLLVRSEERRVGKECRTGESREWCQVEQR